MPPKPQVSREEPSDHDAGMRWLATKLGEKALAGDEDLDVAELQRAADTLYHDKPPEERLPRLRGWPQRRRATKSLRRCAEADAHGVAPHIGTMARNAAELYRHLGQKLDETTLGARQESNSGRPQLWETPTPSG